MFPYFGSKLSGKAEPMIVGFYHAGRVLYVYYLTGNIFIIGLIFLFIELHSFSYIES